MTVIEISQNVDLIELGERKIYLVGTAHVSKASVELAEKTIRDVMPDSVAIELCDSRYQSLQDPDRWKNTDIVKVIKDGKVYVLMAQLMLAAFQKKLGEHLQVKPGAEMMHAANIARELNSNIVLADRDVKTTLKRTWATLSFWSMCKVLFGMLMGLFSNEKMDAEEIERLKSSDALNQLLDDFSKTLPDVRRPLIDERDQYLAAKISSAPGKSVVAVIGAGHVPGIKKWLDKEVDLVALEVIPDKKLSSKILAWLMPGLLVLFIALGFMNSGMSKSVEMLSTWIWINALLAGIGAALALAHPLTILAAALAAPFTAAHPLLASGWVAGLVEASLKKPRVSDLETVADDISTMKGIWSNRVSRILLIVCLTNLLGSFGSLFALFKLSSM